MFAKAPRSGSGISTVVVFARSSLRNTRRVKEPPSIFLEDQQGGGTFPLRTGRCAIAEHAPGFGLPLGSGKGL